MKILTSKIVNGKKMFLIEDNDSQGRVFAQGDKPIKKENISYYNPYYVDIKGINSSDNVSTKSTPSKKITPQELKQIKESPTNVGNIVLKEKQEKAQRLKEAEEAYQKRKSGAPVTPELLAQETQAIGDKISLQNIPGVGKYIPDILDVTGGIGSMASGLGSIPLNLNRGNYGQALLSVASPLTMGALAGVGSPTVGQFVNNLANPLAGTGDLINNLGNKYLPNAYKLNPNAFKPNPNNFYRQVDTPTFNEGLESGLIRGKQDIGYSDESAMKMFGDDAYYNKGRLYYKNEKDYPYLFEANLPEDRFIPKVNGRTRKYTTENTRVRVSKEPLPINDPNIKTYKKDWLQGYKQVEVPKTTQNFKSEINWGQWNKEIPENKALMQEYNTIEQTSKANGTWMKNPDGSTFQGTPEQFIQQNSENFKKAFPDGFENVFRGVRDKTVVKELNPERSMFTADFDLASNYTRNKEILTPFDQFNTLDKSQFNPNVKEGMFNLAHKKSPKSIELDNFGREWTSIDLTNPKQSISNIELNIKHLEEQLKRQKEFLKSGKQNLDGSWSFPDTDIVYSNQLYKEGIKGQEKIINSYKDRLKNINNLVKNEKELEKMKSVLGNKTTTDDIAKYIEDSNLDYVKIKNVDDSGLGDVSIVNHKKGNYLKSLVGNNGMFDMTNPNIYKSIVGALATGTLGKQAVEKQEFGGKIKVLDTKIENGKKYFLINK